MAASNNNPIQQVRDWNTQLLRFRFVLKKRKISSRSEGPALRTLVVGINHYLFQRNIYGSVPDAHRMDEYFRTFVSKSESFAGYYPQLLLDEEATRNNIIDLFNNHLIEQAQAGDFAVFYFSGHGGQERAPVAFRHYEPDGLLEGLVCHDSGPEGAYLIADKELRYLIHQLSLKDCEIVTIFDCSYVGNNTRLELEEGVTEKKISFVHPERSLNNFIFISDIVEASQGIGIESPYINLPEGRHVHLAACKDGESAYEHSIRKFGYFTDSLLRILKVQEGAISYYELIRQARLYMQKQMIQQTPLIYTPRNYRQGIYQLFLSKKVIAQTLKGNISYSRKMKKWMMDLGGIHGMKATKRQGQYPIIVDTGDTELSYARVIEVFTKHSTIEFEPYAAIAKVEIYECYISGLMMAPVFFITEGESEDLAELHSLIEQQYDKLLEENICFVEHPSLAEYKVLVQNGSFAIVKRTDPQQRLLTDYIRGTDSYAAEEMVDRLKHISKWMFIKNLENGDTLGIGADPIQLTVKQSGKDAQVLSSQNSTINIPFADKEKGEQTPQITITLENITHKPLHVACLYLSSLFGVEISYIEPNVVKMEPGEKVMLLNGDPISLEILPHILSDNWPEETVYIKILASTQGFDVNLFALPELPAPPSPASIRGFINKKGLTNTQKEVDDWTTQLFTFSLVNPNFR